jgi:hypothetical protein
MRGRTCLISAVLVVSSVAALAKDKKKNILPTDVLQAHTAWVVVDPDTGIDVRDPDANNSARAAVERALARWGRLTPVADAAMADLVIVVRKGNGKMVEPTIGGTEANSPPPMIGQQTEGGMSGAGRTGPPPLATSGPHPQIESGSTEDTFFVYRGKDASLGSIINSPAVWRYAGNDALSGPEVPAVDAFRKAIEQSEKQLAKP